MIRREAEIQLVMRLVEQLTNRPVGSLSDAVQILYGYCVRYSRAQERLNETPGFDLPDPRAVDVLDGSILLAERYAALVRSIKGLETARLERITYPRPEFDHY
jgi:hypothetical protein